jgi:hypothetical protein
VTFWLCAKFDAKRTEFRDEICISPNKTTLSEPVVAFRGDPEPAGFAIRRGSQKRVEGSLFVSRRKRRFGFCSQSAAKCSYGFVSDSPVNPHAGVAISEHF